MIRHPRPISTQRSTQSTTPLATTHHAKQLGKNSRRNSDRNICWALLVSIWLLLLAPQIAHAQGENEPRTYTVVSGDTLYVIAQSFGITLDELTAYNGITDPNVLEIGQVLLIPPAGGAQQPPAGEVPSETTGEETTAPETAPAAELPIADMVTVRARPGDTVGRVALRYGQPIEQFIAINNVDPNTRVFPGQPFQIPRASFAGEPLRFGAIRTVNVPAQIIQGRTGAVTIETTAPRDISGTWNGLPITFIPEPTASNRYLAYLPAPALIEPNSYWLTITYTASNGTALTQSWPVPIVAGNYELQALDLPPDRLALMTQDNVAPELEKVTAVWSQRTPTLYWTEVFSRPIAPEYPTTSPYGTRRTYYTGGPVSYHEGQDFGVPEGVPVLAPAAGVVALAETLNVRGTAVILDHGGGLFTGYWHLSELRVAAGQSVQPGDVIGISGNTGLSTGAHLHWEMRIYGVAVDPMQFIDQPLIAPQS